MVQIYSAEYEVIVSDMVSEVCENTVYSSIIHAWS